jgi:hypothetical protein
MNEKSDIERLREILNKLAENINILDVKDKLILQKLSEEMDKLVLDYIKNNNY